MDQLTLLATSGATSVWALLGNFVAFLVIAVVFFVFALRAGRPAFISLVLSLYVGFGLFMVFPWKAQLMAGEAMTTTVAGLIIFGILTALPYFIMRKVNTMGHLSIGTIPLFILSLLASGALLAIGYHFLSLATILPATPPLMTYVVPTQYLFYWLIAPLVGFVVVSR
jgi:hypothetical protein|tara:strand:- start:135938 stop:136441 length:504 start_codon:yes stop_codon:yes gene_type:complete